MLYQSRFSKAAIWLQCTPGPVSLSLDEHVAVILETRHWRLGRLASLQSALQPIPALQILLAKRERILCSNFKPFAIGWDAPSPTLATVSGQCEINGSSGNCGNWSSCSPDIADDMQIITLVNIKSQAVQSSVLAGTKCGRWAASDWKGNSSIGY